jgi:tetratricopeptide (TPR) repeat protein
MKCPKCQSENPAEAKFCRKCGQSLRAEMLCPQCGKPILPDSDFCIECGHHIAGKIQTPDRSPSPAAPSPAPVPTSFANGRYQVKKFLGEGGKKKVYLAHDTVLDRDVAFALIKTEKLDETARTRIKREAQAMGRLGDHPNIVTVYDFGEASETNQPYMVLPLLSGGDVEGLIKKAAEHKLPIPESIEIARSVCKGLEFAHDRGIIHRDIKPGNVWMSADGTAKVGDFGLAVAVDRSRLTQVGMMVGTVSYMPPEQAMGGEVTARADLYSLGAMLYEMVTGRPPFVGDDSVAIIGQHINAPPISPSWHRADLPPSLETLIMQLLEKDPQKRPASAKVVLDALESIGKGQAEKTPTKESSAPAENPLYRRVFVGREQELKQLQAAFDGAVSGQGALWMVLGEPGIGKTALCEQLATYVTLRGGKTLVGHCYEEGSLSLPYLAFVEAMRSYVLDREAEALRKDLGSGATDVARIVSEIREKLDVHPGEADSPEEDRYRLMQGVTSFLTNSAVVQPMLVVLEDLHDADRGTLEMLQYVSKNIARTRLLIVATYRDVDVDRNHPLSAALAELRRSSSFGRVLLRGLNADEVSRMLKSIAHDEIPWGLAQAIHAQTEGNPLFVQEVIRYLTEEKLLIRAGGRMIATGSTPLEMNIPEGLRDVIGKRLTRLSENCNRLLSIAAVIGREFRLDVLQKVAGLTDDDLFAAIEEAKRIAIIEERSSLGTVVVYRFAHAYFRTTLYEENIAPRRIRLHLQVARMLEEIHANRLQEHAAELAEHFSYSTDSADLTKAVSYGEMAAERASDVYDYGEAIRLLRQALKVQEVLDPKDKGKRCDLLTAIGRAQVGATDFQRAIDVEYPQALVLAEEIGDRRRAAMVCVGAARAVYVKGVAAHGSRELLRWAERADRYAEMDTMERAWADLMLGQIKCMRGSPVEGTALLRRSLGMARSLQNRELVEISGVNWAAFGIMPWTTAQESMQVALELAKGKSGEVLVAAFAIYLTYGMRDKARETVLTLERLSETTKDVRLISASHLADYALAMVDGRLEESFEQHEHDYGYRLEVGLPTTSSYMVTIGFRTMILLRGAAGRPESASWRAILEGMNAAVFRRIPLLPAHLGKTDEAGQLLDRMLQERPNINSTQDMTQCWLDVIYLEAAVLVGHRKAAELLLKRLADTQMVTTGLIGWLTCVARHLGGAAALLERYDEARQHYQEAIRVCIEMRFRPELALTRLQLAELLLDHYPAEKKEALEHLDFAVKEFREMKMQPSLERALRRKEILKA